MADTIKNRISCFLIRKLDDLIKRLQDESLMGNIYDQILKLKKIELVVHGNIEVFEKNTTPLIIVCNHPLGILDGLVLGAFANQQNLNFKIVANEFLLRLDQFNRDFIPVDPYGTRNSLARNIAPLKETLSWLNKKNTLIVFPAGDVAKFYLKKMCIIEAPWRESIGKIIQRSNAYVLPVYIKGKNSNLFYLLKWIHVKLGTLRLCKECIDKVNQTIEIRIGNIIEPDRLKKFSNVEELTSFLRATTLDLAHNI